MRLILLLLLSSFSAFSQPENSLVNANSGLIYNSTAYTRENGLASSTLTTICQDSTGFLWLFSENGLTRFDGYDFRVFVNNQNDFKSISSSYVYDMCVDKKGNTLFRTYNSISKYYSQTNTFKKLLTFHQSDYFVNWKIQGEFIWVVVKGNLIRIDAEGEKTTYYKLPTGFEPRTSGFTIQPDGSVFLAGQKNIVYFHQPSKTFSQALINYGDSLSPFLKAHAIRFFMNKNNKIGFFNTDGLFVYNNEKKQFLLKHKLNKIPELKAGPYSYLLAKDGMLVSTTFNGKIHQINIETGKENLIKPDQIASMEKNQFKLVFHSRNGNVWVTTNTNQLYAYNPDDLTLSRVSIFKENEMGNIYNLFEDDKGILWISVVGTGLIKAEPIKKIIPVYRPKALQNKSSSNSSDNVRGIAEWGNNKLLINTINDILLFDRNKNEFTSLPFSERNFSGSAYGEVLVDKDSNIWVGGWQRQGLFCINTRSKTTTRFTPVINPFLNTIASVRCMLIDTKGFLWIGTSDNNILKTRFSDINYNIPSETKFEVLSSTTLHNEKLLFDIVFSISESSSGEIYFGTQNGVYIYNHSTGNIKQLIANNSALGQLTDVRSFYFDNDLLWMGTNGNGLACYNLKTQNLSFYTTVNGLPDNAVYTVLADKKNNLWLGTNKGLCRFSPQTKLVRNFSLKDGIQNYEYNTNASLLLSTGELAFGGVNGLNIFYSDSLNTSSEVPEVIITQFNIEENQKPIIETGTQLRYNENYISFQFAALNYLRNEENQYAYKLEGLDKDWIYCGKRRFTNYANLPPGHYSFKVKCSNANGIWNEQGSSLNFSIATPWFSSWWFRTLLLLTFIAGIYGWYRYRLNQALKLQAVRDRIGRDLHDEIGSTLQSISFYSEVAGKVVEEKAPEAKSMLSQISESTTNMMEAMSDIVWAINTRNDSFANIINRMRAFAVEVLEAKNCNLHFDISDTLLHYNLEMEERKNLYLIFKESINNSAKHSGCKNVWISFKTKGASLNLIIKDDGKGFMRDENFIGNGLFNIEKRASELKGIIQIQSEPGKGTIINLSFKP